MFNLILFPDISDGLAGMLIPVLSSPTTNLPYVQQMDEFLQVREVIPFLEHENYPTLPSEQRRVVAVGDKGLAAFRSFDETIVCGDVTEIVQYISRNREHISRHPILHSQLNRVEAAELTPSYEIWRKVAAKVFVDEGQQKFWIDSEMHLLQRQKRIWDDLDPMDVEDPDRARADEFYSRIAEYSPEYLFQWLSSRANFISRE